MSPRPARDRDAAAPDILLTRAPGYLLDVDSAHADAHRFERLIQQGTAAAERGADQEALALLGAALELWRGEPLEDIAEAPFAQAAARRLSDLRLLALERRIELQLRGGRTQELIAELEELVAFHPYRETFHAQLMLALYRSGRQTEALAVFRRARALLVDELGIEPGPALRELEHAILAQDPALRPPSRERGRPPATAAWRVRRGGLLIGVGGVLLLAVITIVAAALAGSSASSLRVMANSVAAIDARTDRVAVAVAVGARPAAIAFGSGSLWVANVDDQTVSRIDPRTLRTLRTIPVGAPPTGIAATPDGIWVAESDLSPNASKVSVTRLDPEFDALGPSVQIGTVVPREPGAVAATAQGNSVWVAPSSGLLTRLDPRTGRVAQQIDPNATPAGIAIGDGAVWLTDPQAGNVIRVDSTGLLTPIAVGNAPSGFAVGAGGVWVADSLDNAIVRIDPNTRAVTSTIQVGRSPSGIAVGAGSVWVANRGDGTVTRIDPRTEEVLATIAVGGSPWAITIADGRAWVSVDARSVARTDVASGGRTLRIESPSDVDSMDPALAYQSLSTQLMWATCAQLVNYPDTAGPAGSLPIPEVARSLPAMSADGRTYTFTIRRGFRFSPRRTSRSPRGRSRTRSSAR